MDMDMAKNVDPECVSSVSQYSPSRHRYFCFCCVVFASTDRERAFIRDGCDVQYMVQPRSHQNANSHRDAYQKWIQYGHRVAETRETRDNEPLNGRHGVSGESRDEGDETRLRPIQRSQFHTQSRHGVSGESRDEGDETRLRPIQRSQFHTQSRHGVVGDGIDPAYREGVKMETILRNGPYQPILPSYSVLGNSRFDVKDFKTYDWLEVCDGVCNEAEPFIVLICISIYIYMCVCVCVCVCAISIPKLKIASFASVVCNLEIVIRSQSIA